MPAPQRTTATTPIVFKDFKAGISDKPGANYGPENATRANTWRCIANAAGALVPLPWRTEPFNPPVDEWPVASGRIAVIGLYTPPIVVLPIDNIQLNIDLIPAHELHVAVEFLSPYGHAQPRSHVRWRRYRRYELPGTNSDTVKSFDAPSDAVEFLPSGMDFTTVRSNRADPTQPGPAVVVGLWGAGNPTQGSSASGGSTFLSTFPDDQNPTVMTPYDIFTGADALMHGICGHQSRVIAQKVANDARGPGTFTFTGENLIWSSVKTVDTARWTTAPANFVGENASGYGFMISMSANELFAVKIHGGLYVQGNLGDPDSTQTASVVNLPMVVGTEVHHRPAVSEIGVIYGTLSSGVWLWSHGDTSQLLSPMLEPDFWLIDESPIKWGLWAPHTVQYTFDRCGNWVLVSNNWLFDTNLKSWWRIEDPSEAAIRTWTSISQFIYGAESFYTNTSGTPIHFWRRDVAGPSFSWQSHPIWQSVADIVNVSTIELVAQGHGQVTLSLTALDGTTNSITVQLADAGHPERFREAFAIQGKYLQLRIESDSLVPYYHPAPTVYSVTLYPYTEAPIGHTL